LHQRNKAAKQEQLRSKRGALSRAANAAKRANVKAKIAYNAATKEADRIERLEARNHFNTVVKEAADLAVRRKFARAFNQLPPPSCSSPQGPCTSSCIP